MINSLIGILARMAVGKQVLTVVADIYEMVDGKKSELLILLLALTHLAKLAGILQPEAARSIEASLAGALPLTLADRARKVLDFTDRFLPSR